MDKLKVENHPNLYRDTNTNMIVNSDSSSYQNYINLKKNKESERKRIEKLENDIGQVKNDLGEIKDLLRNLSK
jgi:conjugal transfer/entry exclusion protein